MKPKHSFVAASLAALLPLTAASAFQGPIAVETRASVAESEALERALAAVSESNIRADLHFIASDELAGRDTPSEGLRHAARYIRARLERLGFVPAGSRPDSYFHLYQLEKAKLDVAASSALVTRGGEDHELEFGRDYYFRSSGISNLETAGDVVFAGTGSSADVAGLDLTGKFALVFESNDVPSGERDAGLAEAGASGILIASPLDGQDRHNGKRAEMFAQWVGGRPSMRIITRNEDMSLPTSYVTRETARTILGDVVEPAVGQALGARFTDRRKVEEGGEIHELENVAGLWPGSDPELKNEVLIVSAHYDHVGVGEDGAIYNGADDNGSGTVGMMAIAEALAAHGPMKRSVLMLWVSGEEKGLLGSYAWTKDSTLPDGMRAVCNLNIDMIGRNAPDYLLITPTKDHPAYNGLTRMAEAVAPEEGFPVLGSCDQYWQRSDHMNFSVNLGIPVAFLFSDVHDDYHKPTDTVEKIDYDKIRRVSRVVVRMLDRLQDLNLEAL